MRSYLPQSSDVHSALRREDCDRRVRFMLELPNSIVRVGASDGFCYVRHVERQTRERCARFEPSGPTLLTCHHSPAYPCTSTGNALKIDL